MHRTAPPGALLRLLFRLPLLLYRARLGWLLGSRFLMLTHTGRRSGLPRKAVLEVVHRDASAGSYYVVAAYARHADWFRNIMQDPHVCVTAGRRTFPASAESLEHAAARDVLAEYARQHPRALRTIARLFRLEYDGSAQSIDSMALALPVVSLCPR